MNEMFGDGFSGPPPPDRRAQNAIKVWRQERRRHYWRCAILGFGALLALAGAVRLLLRLIGTL